MVNLKTLLTAGALLGSLSACSGPMTIPGFASMAVTVPSGGSVSLPEAGQVYLLYLTIRPLKDVPGAQGGSVNTPAGTRSAERLTQDSADGSGHTGDLRVSLTLCSDLIPGQRNTLTYRTETNNHQPLEQGQVTLDLGPKTCP